MKKQTKSILVVNETPENLQDISKILAHEKFVIRVANNGKEAIESIKAEAPDLILMDIQMPGIDGYETCRRIKSMSQFESIPIIFLSALTETADIAKAFEAGGQDYITKPFKEQEVTAKVRMHLKMHEYQEQMENIVEERTKEIEKRKQIELKHEKLLHDVGERMKELNCLYSISQFINDPENSFEDVLQKSTNIIPQSWQYPEYTCGKIVLDKKEFTTPNFKETEWKQSTKIIIEDKVIGRIDVYYTKEMPASEIGPFMKEEKDLIEGISRKIGGFYVKKLAETKLKTLNEELENKVKERTKQLDSAQERLNSAMNAAKMGNWEYHVTEDRFSTSDSLNEIYGFTENEDIDLGKLFAMIYPDDIEKVQEYTDYLLNNEGSYEREYRIITEGEIKWIFDKGKSYKNAEGKIDIVAGIVSDITFQKKAEKELQQIYELSDNALDLTKAGFWKINYDDAEYYYSSERAAAIFGEMPNEEYKYHLTDEWLSRIIQASPEIAEKTGVHYQDAVDGKIERYDVIYPYVRPVDGDTVWIRAIGYVERDEKGKALTMNGVAQDITEQKKAEEELALLNQLVYSSLDAAEIGAWWIDFNEEDTIHALDTTANLLGLPMKKSNDNLYTTNEWRNILIKTGKLNTEYKKITEDTFEQFIGTISGKYETYRASYPVLQLDGSIRWIIARADVPKRRKDGTALLMTGTIIDITELKHAEKVIRDSEIKFRSIFDNSTDAIRVTLEGKHVLVNPSFVKIFGYDSEEEIYEIDALDLVAPSEYNRIKKYLKKRAVGEDVPTNYETKGIKKNGDIFDFEINVSSYKIDDNNYTLSIIQDISVRKKAEEELSKAKQKMELAIDAANVGIWDWDLQKDELVWDEALYKLYGIDSDSFSGAYEAWINGVHPEDAKQAEATLMAAIKEDKVFDSEFRVVWPDKTIRYIRGLGKLLKNESGEPDRMIGVNWDITDSKLNEVELMKAKEIAEDATKAKSAFLASMSHEIRTPMNAVIGLSHLALQTKLTPKQHDYIYKIRSSGKALLGIINDILDFSKIEAGKLSIEITPFDLEKVFVDVATVITYKAHEKGLEVVFNISSDIPLLLVGDPLRIGQILINLANNAVKFTNKGEIVIQVEMEENPPSIDKDNSLEAEDNIWLRFSVKDTGIGIKEDQINRLFESFSQGDRSTSRKFGGTGLGLAISKNLVEMMQGGISVESQFGKGSTFAFNIKLEQQKEQKQKVFVPSNDLQNMKVLVCDDNLTSLEVLTSMLQSFSFEVKAVNSGAKAIIELEKEIGKPYELVLLDWKMPELDGLEVAEKIKLNKKLAKIPTIIMVTAYTRDQIIHKVDELQLAGLLTKPVSHSTMFDTIMEAFGKGVTHRPSDQILDAKYEEKLNQRKGARILLVEDNEINQQVAAEMIESADFIVEIANNGLEAINRMHKRADFDLVFMDIQMPVMDGITATEKLRNDSKFDNIPIVAMTADVIAGVKERCLNIGMNDFITKPISPESVFEAIIKWTKPGERDLSKLKIDTAKPLTEQIVIPDLDRINVNEGLIRVNRNSKLYQNLLFKFYNNNVNLINQIKKAYETGNEETALRLVHTVKGVSGNIGANELHQTTVELERKLKEKDYTDLNEIIDDYAQSLNPVLHAIAEYRNSQHSVNQEANKEDNEAKLNKELFAKLCDSLTTLLEDNDPEAIAIVEEVLGLPGIGESRKQLRDIENLVKNYDFDASLNLLIELRNKIE